MSPALPVIVIVGKPDDPLLAGLRSLGLRPVAEDGAVVIWGPAAKHSGAPAPRTAEPPGSTANLLMTIRDAAETLALSRSTVYELIGRGQLEVVHIGRSTRVTAAAVHSFIEQLRGSETAETNNSVESSTS
jgi:excisionase family DNA binding protein